jgi:transposase InsO family protein
VVMDQFTRRIIGFGVHEGEVDGVALCRMFNTAISTRRVPHYPSSDHDRLFRYHRLQANLRIHEINKIKSIPNTPVSHPFVERLIGTIRRNTLTMSSSGMRRILNENLVRFYSITTIPALISLSVGTHPLKLAASINRQPQNSSTIHGYHTAMVFFRRRLLHE